MSADIIPFRTVRREQPSEPALTPRQALAEIARDAAPSPITPDVADLWADDFEARLWILGFIIVPASDTVIR